MLVTTPSTSAISADDGQIMGAAAEEELTTKQAADLLRVSRPFLVRSLLGKEIPFEKVGTQRRVRIDDVLAYRERRARERRTLLNEMTEAAQDVPGGYR